MQVLLQPVNRLSVKVVGRLVKEQDVRLLQQQTAESHTAALTSREVLYLRIVRRTTQGVHSAVKATVYIPCIHAVKFVLQLCLACQQFVEVRIWLSKGHVDGIKLSQHVHDRLYTLLYALAHSLLRVELWVLLQIAYAIARREYHFAFVVLLDTCDDLEQGGLTRTVETNDTDFCSVEETEVNVIEYSFLWGEGLAYAHH